MKHVSVVLSSGRSSRLRIQPSNVLSTLVKLVRKSGCRCKKRKRHNFKVCFLAVSLTFGLVMGCECFQAFHRGVGLFYILPFFNCMRVGPSRHVFYPIFVAYPKKKVYDYVVLVFCCTSQRGQHSGRNDVPLGTAFTYSFSSSGGLRHGDTLSPLLSIR